MAFKIMQRIWIYFRQLNKSQILFPGSALFSPWNVEMTLSSAISKHIWASSRQHGRWAHSSCKGFANKVEAARTSSPSSNFSHGRSSIQHFHVNEKKHLGCGPPPPLWSNRGLHWKQSWASLPHHNIHPTFCCGLYPVCIHCFLELLTQFCLG